MRILIAGLVKNSQLARLKVEGKKRGHKVDGCYAGELVIYADKEKFEPTLRGKSMENYDLIYIWSVGKRRWEWYVACYYLSDKYKTRIVNYKIVDPNYKLYLSPAMNYLKQTNNKVTYPKSAVIFSTKSIESVETNFEFPLIVKSSAGRQGRRIYKVENIGDLINKTKELLEYDKPVIVREFIDNDGDVRVFTVGYKAIGGMLRTPKKGEFRSNISLGGKGSEYDLEKNTKVRILAEKMSKLTRTEIAGVDIMIHKETDEAYVLEVNPGPQFTGLEKYTATNAALEIIKYFETIIKK